MRGSRLRGLYTLTRLAAPLLAGLCPRLCLPKSETSDFGWGEANFSLRRRCHLQSASLHSFKAQWPAMRLKSLSVDSIVRPWRMQSCANRASIVPI